MNKYRHETTRNSLGETGDYSETTKITNDVETHYINECELSDEDLDKLCELLDEIPSLWNVKNDALEFENIQLKSKLEQAEKEKRELDEKLTNILWNDEIGYKTKVYRCKNLLKQIEA